ncbi:NADH-dependent flavin oxidoreductase [Paucilactobacillus kaifaensis]|uniref:NADH-dependent flavin oxidoreductase n=1 Tax=Paucilactobacillus kaifaensis TaxID=2559921 RepID=UPI0010F8E03C|nr:NADH-dependent flavin oxidoreductase [Paucilactobacillus kaifaensis]
MAKYSFLEPFKFFNKDVVLKNRVIIPPMTECMAFHDGTVTEDEVDYYKKHSGGVGMYITAVANVNNEGKGFEGELSIADDKFIPGLHKLASAIQRNGTKAIVQIFSAGRMSSTAILRGKKPVSASAIAAVRAGSEEPRSLSETEIEQTIKDFGQAARRAIEAGFDGVEIYGANTYLIQQFFSPHSNQRADKWGGSVENRMQFPLAVISEVQRVVTEYATKPFIIGYRISPEEIEKPGITFDQTLAFVDVLKDQPIDYLHVSMGNVWRKSLTDESITTPLNETIKEHLQGKVPMIVVGDVQTPEDAAKATDAGFDLVGIGRQSIREPQWVQKIEHNDESSIRYKISPDDLDELGVKKPFLDILMALSGPTGIPLTTSVKTDRQNANAVLDYVLSGGK